MINKETMNTLRKLAEGLNKLNPEGIDTIIFLAVSEEAQSGTSVINGNEPAVMAALTSLLDTVFDDAPCEAQKRMKRFLIKRILE